MENRSLDLDLLTERVATIEKENRVLKRALVVALAVATLPLVLAAAERAVPKAIEATKVVIRDTRGAIRAELGVQSDGAATLAFLDGKGAGTMTLRGVSAGPILEMADGQGGSVWLSSSATGASLALSKGKGEIEIASNATGEPSLKLQDRDGKIVWHAP